jgi:hypothetical protein
MGLLLTAMETVVAKHRDDDHFFAVKIGSDNNNARTTY